MFGNPWRCIASVVGCPAQPSYAGPPDLQCCVERYRGWLACGVALSETGERPKNHHELTASLTAARLPDLRGKNLACWCRLDQPCHADVLLELANAPLRCEAADA